MKQFSSKFRRIFLPFLFISITSTIVYTFFHWLLFINTVMMPVDEDILNLVVPMVLIWIPILIWLRPKIKLLNLKNKSGKGDPLFGYMMFAWMAMLAPMIIAQNYLISATGKLTNLDNISQIDKFPATKYYKARHFYIDKKFAGFHTKFETSGKYNQNLEMYIYVAVPMYDKLHGIKTHHFTIGSPQSAINSNNALLVLDGKVISKDELEEINPRSINSVNVLKGSAAIAIYGDKAKNGAILIKVNPDYKGSDTLMSIHDDDINFTPSAWIGVRFNKTISNKLSANDKEEAYKAFVKESDENFKSMALDGFIYLDKINYSKDRKGYVKAVKNSTYPYLENNAIILTSVNEPFEARNGNKLPWIFGALGIGSAVFLITLLFKPLKQEDDKIAETEEQKESVSSTSKELKLFFVPRKGFSVTPILIDINISLFIIMVCAGLGFISFNGADLMKWGANYRPAIHDGEYWRLLTNIFLHGGIMHVLMNMYGLLFIGIFLEPVLGTKKYLFAYLLAGIIASIASVWWHPATVSVGASGAIFGMYGVFLALLTVNIFPSTAKKSLLISTSIFIGYNLLFGLTGGIDNAAHIGGLLSGVIIGYALYPSLKDKIQQEQAAEKELLDQLKEKEDEQLTD